MPCVAEESFFLCGCGDGANSSRLFILRSGVQVPRVGQLTVNHLFGCLSEWEEAEENETVMDDVEMLSAIDLRNWTTMRAIRRNAP